ncbi:MAG: hypothetical protein PHI31_17775, partial [Desulfuromonadaceae bacterium]|nr:hypothetical protein [Desulfuromonadaceae bacterium]
MRRKLLFMMCSGLVFLTLAGCGGMIGSWSRRENADKRQNLASGVEMIRAGLDKEARYYLERVVDDS